MNAYPLVQTHNQIDELPHGALVQIWGRHVTAARFADTSEEHFREGIASWIDTYSGDTLRVLNTQQSEPGNAVIVWASVSVTTDVDDSERRTLIRHEPPVGPFELLTHDELRRRVVNLLTLMELAIVFGDQSFLQEIVDELGRHSLTEDETYEYWELMATRDWKFQRVR